MVIAFKDSSMFSSCDHCHHHPYRPYHSHRPISSPGAGARQGLITNDEANYEFNCCGSCFTALALLLRTLNAHNRHVCESHNVSCDMIFFSALHCKEFDYFCCTIVDCVKYNAHTQLLVCVATLVQDNVLWYCGLISHNLLSVLCCVAWLLSVITSVINVRPLTDVHRKR